MRKLNKLTPGENLRWESSRMMLPEHVQALKKHDREEKQMKKPMIDTQLLEDMDRIVREAAAHAVSVDISYYDDGAVRRTSGMIVRYDAIGRALIIRPAGDRPRSLALSNIVRVERLP
ncbi:YolD-like family protein [Sporolactobacillus sp. THM7-7]|nr:YolD-like family protein [Sporolactobacillus sp. THM7-7]